MSLLTSPRRLLEGHQRRALINTGGHRAAPPRRERGARHLGTRVLIARRHLLLSRNRRVDLHHRLDRGLAWRLNRGLGGASGRRLLRGRLGWITLGLHGVVADVELGGGRLTRDEQRVDTVRPDQRQQLARMFADDLVVVTCTTLVQQAQEVTVRTESRQEARRQRLGLDQQLHQHHHLGAHLPASNRRRTLQSQAKGGCHLGDVEARGLVQEPLQTVGVRHALDATRGRT